MTAKLFIETSAITSDNMSGIGHTLVSILRAWQQDESIKGKFDVFLLVPFDKVKKVESLDIKLPIKRIYMSDRLIRGLRKFNIFPYMDWFFGKGVYLFPNFWNWPLFNSKSITYVYDVSFLVYPEFSEPKNQKFLARHLPVWLKRADKIITISNHAKSEIIKFCNVDSSKIEVVYNGVDSDQPADISNKKLSTIKKQYGISSKYILFVGNIEPRKNIRRLISAYRLLPENLRLQYSLVIIGGYGWNNEAIKQDIQKSKQDGLNINKVAKFVSDDDLKIIYSGATILVHPALYEGFGMTPLEAMVAGTPVIVGNNSSLPEVVGDAGLYVDAMKIDDISAKIRELLESPSERLHLQTEGKKRAEKFTWAQTLHKLASIMERYIDE